MIRRLLRDLLVALRRLARPLLYLLAAALLCAAAVVSAHSRVSAPASAGVETIYVKNLSPKFWSDHEILKDIPGWEDAVNNQFSQVWHTPKVKIVLLTHGARAPRGAIVAVIKKNGTQAGALAFHGLYQGHPEITVYSGVGDFFGYNNSISFTHELFEMLGDPNISSVQYGWWPYPFIWIGKQRINKPADAAWFGEVCDPVEAFTYFDKGAAISDWVKPNWYNAHTSGGYDFMNMVHNPFTIARGGYAFFWYNNQWIGLKNFSRTNRIAAGFFYGEKLAHESAP